MTMTGPESVDSHRIARLVSKLSDSGYRHSYLAQHLRSFLADQFRALRGDRTQREFGRILKKPQSVVSRLEDENYGKHTLQSLLDIAKKLDVALLVQFVDFPTFLKFSDDNSDAFVAPQSYRQDAIDALARDASQHVNAYAASAHGGLMETESNATKERGNYKPTGFIGGHDQAETNKKTVIGIAS